MHVLPQEIIVGITAGKPAVIVYTLKMSVFVGRFMLKYGVVYGMLPGRGRDAMFRLLIADSSDSMAKLIKKQLKDDFSVRISKDPNRVLEILREFEPDILLIDTMLCGQNTTSLLRMLRQIAQPTKMIVTTPVYNELLAVQLTQCGVSGVLMKPYSLGAVVTAIRDIALLLENGCPGDWNLENEIDRILLSLGFRMGPKRYSCVFESILARYHNGECSMKELYIDVAKVCGGNYERVEKAVRDAIEDAYTRGEQRVWRMYFSKDRKREKPYPSNEEFIARIAACLTCLTRLKPPREKGYEIAK